MVDTSTLEGVLRASQRPRRTQKRQTEQPRPRTVEEAMRGTDPRSGYSRADVDLAERRGGEMLLAPLSTLTDEAKRTGAVERGTPLSYGLTAAAFLGDLFNPSIDIPVAAGIRGLRRAAPAFMSPGARQSALMRRILKDPETYVQTTRSTKSMDDILQGGFQSSRQTGVTGAGLEDATGKYNDLRAIAEYQTYGPGVENVQYGALMSPVLRNQPRPLPIGQSGRRALEEYLQTARRLDPSITAPYGSRGEPVQYVWSPEAMQNARFFSGDSMWGQSTSPGRDVTSSFTDFVNSFSGDGPWVRPNNKRLAELGLEPAPKNWYNSPAPDPYIEVQTPNLSLDDIVRIESLQSGPQGNRVLNQINEAVQNSGRNIPTGIAQSADPSRFDMPPGISERLRALLSRLRSRNQSPGMDLNDWEALEFNPPAL